MNIQKTLKKLSNLAEQMPLKYKLLRLIQEETELLGKTLYNWSCSLNFPINYTSHKHGFTGELYKIFQEEITKLNQNFSKT